MIGDNWKQYHKNSFYNCYIGDLDHTDFSNNIFCLYTTTSTDSEEQAVAYYPVDDTSWMYVYDVPKEYQEDYNTFVNSKYSKFSNEYKDKILEFFGIDRAEGRWEQKDKPPTPYVRQVIFPKDSDRVKYILERIGCEYEKDCEILDRIDEREVFSKQEYASTQANDIIMHS